MSEEPAAAGPGGNRRARVYIRDGSVQWSRATAQAEGGTAAFAVARGHADLDNAHLSGEGLSGLVARTAAQPDPTASLRRLSASLEGSFAFVAWTGDVLVACVDRYRSIGLFYAVDGDRLRIGDAPDVLVTSGSGIGSDLNPVREFLVVGYVTGADTLYDGIRTLRAGEFLEMSPSTPAPLVSELPALSGSDVPPSDPMSVARDRFTAVFERLRRSTEGRRLVVGLSEGSDSRGLACGLRMFGFRNVFCYHHASPGAKSLKVTRSIAGTLGYPLAEVICTRARWARWSESGDYLTYRRQGHLGVSIPVLQEWAVLGELHDRGLLRSDDVLICGHSDPTMAGQLRSTFFGLGRFDAEAVVEHILAANYGFWPWQGHEEFASWTRARVAEQIGALSGATEAAAAILRWYRVERVSKLLLHSYRGAEFWGMDWLAPLCDRGLGQFWQSLGSAGYDRDFYYEALNRILVAPMGVPGFAPTRIGQRVAGRYGRPGEALVNVGKTLRRTCGWVRDPRLGRHSPRQLFDELKLCSRLLGIPPSSILYWPQVNVHNAARTILDLAVPGIGPGAGEGNGDG